MEDHWATRPSESARSWSMPGGFPQLLENQVVSTVGTGLGWLAGLRGRLLGHLSSEGDILEPIFSRSLMRGRRCLSFLSLNNENTLHIRRL